MIDLPERQLTVCTKCGGSLFRDMSVEKSYRVEGRTGTRLYCLMGCTSRYVTSGVIDPLRTARPEPRRRLFTLTCKTRGCRTTFPSLSSTRKYCTPCGMERQTQRVKKRNATQRAARRPAALSTPARTPQWTARQTHDIAMAGLGRR